MACRSSVYELLLHTLRLEKRILGPILGVQATLSIVLPLGVFIIQETNVYPPFTGWPCGGSARRAVIFGRISVGMPMDKIPAYPRKAFHQPVRPDVVLEEDEDSIDCRGKR